MKAKKWISALLAAVMAATMLFAGSVTAGAAQASGKKDSLTYDDESGYLLITGLSNDAMLKANEVLMGNGQKMAMIMLICYDKKDNAVFRFTAFQKGYELTTTPDYSDTFGYPTGGFSLGLNENGKKAFEEVRGKITSYDFMFLYAPTPDTRIDDLIPLHWVEKQACSLGGSSNSGTSKSVSSLSAKVKNQIYTGKSCTPDVTIKDGSKTLKKGTDYTLTYQNNKAIGTASVTIKGKGDYSGEKTLTFKIVPKKTTLTAKKSGEKITLSWKKVDGAEKYQIYYREKGSEKYKKLATVSGSKTSYSTSKLDKNKTYQFKIRSYAETGGKKYYSNYSKVVTTK